MNEERVNVQIGMKINTGNYENQDISFGISNVPVGASPEYLAKVKVEALKTITDVLGTLADELFRLRVENYGK